MFCLDGLDFASDNNNNISVNNSILLFYNVRSQRMSNSKNKNNRTTKTKKIFGEKYYTGSVIKKITIHKWRFKRLCELPL